MNANAMPAVAAYCKAAGLSPSDTDRIWVALVDAPGTDDIDLPSGFGYAIEDAIGRFHDGKL